MTGDIFESFFGDGPAYLKPGTRVEWRKPGKAWQAGTIIPTPATGYSGPYWIETETGAHVFCTPKNVRPAD